MATVVQSYRQETLLLQYFLSEENTEHLITCAYKMGLNNGEDPDINELKEMIPKLMKCWERLDDFRYSDSLTGDIWEELKYMNQEFRDEYNDRFCNMKNMLNDFNGLNSNHKSYNGLYGKYETVDTYRTANVWKPVEVFRTNKHFRYGNAIPKWQQHGRRMVDRDVSETMRPNGDLEAGPYQVGDRSKLLREVDKRSSLNQYIRAAPDDSVDCCP